MPVWKLVHILGMVGAFALILVPLYLQIGAARSGDVRTARLVFTMGKSLSLIGFALFGVGLVGGIAALITGGWAGTAPWLLATYALLVAVGVLDGGLLGPWRKRVERALASAEAASLPSPELHALLCSARPVSYAWLATAAFVAVVALMVLKPSFGL